MSHMSFLHKLRPFLYKSLPFSLPLHTPRLHLHNQAPSLVSVSSPASIMASNQPSNDSSMYQSAGGFQNFMHSYGGKMWNDADVQEAKAIGAAMKQYDSQQAKSSGRSTKSSSSSSNRK